MPGVIKTPIVFASVELMPISSYIVTEALEGRYEMLHNEPVYSPTRLAFTEATADHVVVTAGVSSRVRSGQSIEEVVDSLIVTSICRFFV